MVDFSRWETKLAKFVRAFGAQKLASELGIQRSAIYHWIAGKFRPDPDHARKMVVLAKGMGKRLSLADIYAHGDRFRKVPATIGGKREHFRKPRPTTSTEIGGKL